MTQRMRRLPQVVRAADLQCGYATLQRASAAQTQPRQVVTKAQADALEPRATSMPSRPLSHPPYKGEACL